jgi:diadenylate cyclase
MLSQVLYYITTYFGAVLQVLVLTALFYHLLVLLRSTRVARMLLAVIAGVVVFVALVYFLQLDVLYQIFKWLSMYIIMLTVVIFQPEIRRAFTMMGSRWKVLSGAGQKGEGMREILEMLSKQRCGALIAIEQKVSLLTFQDIGVTLDAAVMPELVAAIFYSGSALHDGGMIIRNGRIAAARCVFPLAQESPELEHLGMRHRAAVGLSEETDAVVLIVSEQTGEISIAHDGRLYRDVSDERLQRYLDALIRREQKEAASWKYLKLFDMLLRRKKEAAE